MIYIFLDDTTTLYNGCKQYPIRFFVHLLPNDPVDLRNLEIYTATTDKPHIALIPHDR